MFTIFPRADLIRRLGINAAFNMPAYQPSMVLNQFRHATQAGYVMQAPSYPVIPAGAIAYGAEQVAKAFVCGQRAQVTLLNGATFLADPIQSVNTENPVINAVLQAARRSASGNPATIQSEGRAATVRATAPCARGRWGY